MQTETDLRFRKRFRFRRDPSRPGQSIVRYRQINGTEWALGYVWRTPRGWFGRTMSGVALGPVPERRALVRCMDYLVFEASHRRRTS